jgi:inorganic pyrophosphatase
MDFKMIKKSYYAIVEQRKDDEYRNNYDPKTSKFEITKYKSLLFERGFTGIYGWLDGYGYPPNRHLDVIVITSNDYDLGSRIEVKIIGVFLRNDNDNKLIAVDFSRCENEIDELPINEYDMIKGIYPSVKNGEGWFGKEVAEKAIEEYLKTNP